MASASTVPAIMALNPIALGIFGSYFGIILGLFGLLGSSLVSAARRNGLSKTKVGLMGVLGIASFYHTWYCQ